MTKVTDGDTDLVAEIMTKAWQKNGSSIENQTACLVLAQIVAARKQEPFIVKHFKERWGEERFQTVVRIAIPIIVGLIVLRGVMIWEALDHIKLSK